MSTIAELLRSLEANQIRIWSEGENLRFSAPTGVMTAEMRKQMAARKVELIAFLQKALDASTPVQQRIPKAEHDGVLPVSFSQERLWFLDRLEGPSATYNVFKVLRLRGKLNEAALNGALADIVQRHESLRTTFEHMEAAKSPQQRIHPQMDIALEVVDVSATPEVELWNEACRRAAEIIKTAFDLKKGPLVRFHLVRLSPQDQLLVFTLHHIISDGWSIMVLLKDFAACYEARLMGKKANLQEINRQFADYAIWQRQTLQANVLEAELAHWQLVLSAAPHLLELPTDYPRPAHLSQNGGHVRWCIPLVQTNGLQEFVRLEDVSLFGLLMTAWSILLSRYSGETDIVVGFPVANRNHFEMEPVVGFMMNMIALRIQMDGDPTVREVLCRVREATLDALTHASIPFERLVQELNPPRNLSYAPLFQVAMAFEDETTTMVSIEGAKVEVVDLHTNTAKFDLMLWIASREEGLTLTLEYAADLFTKPTIERMREHFDQVLFGLIASPNVRISEIPVLTQADRQQMIKGWSGTYRNYPQDKTVRNLVEEQAARLPHKVAVVCGETQITFAELNRRANHLAHSLRLLGVGPDVLVGICLERSVDMVIAMFAVQKAGGAYVPLDLALPTDRLSFMIEDSAVGIIVTSSRAAAELPPHRMRTVFVEEVRVSGSLDNDLTDHVALDSLAYVRYTSGSTGRPKGVAIQQRALLNFLLSMTERPGCTSGDVLLAVTTYSFDISELEIWLPLICGGRIVLATRDQAADSAELLRLIGQHKVTVMQATPATWQLMIDGGWIGNRRLKALCGGEALQPDLAEKLLPRCAELWNMYGPTETTVWSTCARVTSSSEIHIGRPIANTEIYVLDRHLQPVPVGVTGELLIGGNGLAAGYLNRPELTDEKFIPHPFRRNAKLYRTGDLAKYRPDSNIVCLGRTDSQVKVRGYRIELGEVEAVLARVPGIKAAVVVLHQDQLIAYYVSESGHPVEVSTCREILRTWLPDYMMPAIFVPLETVPLTANGKVDRNALPSPNVSASSVSNVYAAPRTNTEQKMVAIWEEILQRSPIGIHDNFFDVGGHSLLAVTLFAKVERELGRRLPLASLFQNGTIAQLARLVETDREQKDQWESLVCIRQNRGAPGVFLIHGAGGNILIYLSLTRHLLDGVSVYGLQSPGLDGHKRPLRTIEEMAVSYVDEITRRQPVGPYVLAGYCMGGKIALEMARVLNERGQSVAMLAMLDTFNVNLANAANFRTSKLSYVCQMIMFHASNLFAHGPQESWLYLREKVRQAHEVTAGFLSAIFNNFHLPQRNGSVGSKVVVQEFIQSVNDRAGFAYIPRSYSGPVTLFKPKRNYSVFSDPKMGWSEVLTGPLEIVELDMNPHAMLVEPFVQKPAAEINIRLCDLFKLRPSDDGNRAKPGVAHPTSHT